jgi:hypothetical protein
MDSRNVGNNLKTQNHGTSRRRLDPAFTRRSLFRNSLSGCESNLVVKEWRLLTRESESSKGLFPGCEPNLHGCFRTPRATGSELKLAPRSPNRRKLLEIQGFDAKSREHSLSAFCVNWLTGSFRAKNLSSLGETLFESDQETRAKETKIRGQNPCLGVVSKRDSVAKGYSGLYSRVERRCRALNTANSQPRKFHQPPNRHTLNR